MLLALPSSWGPSTHGVTTHINEVPPSLGPVVSLDIETDELDHFVGGAIYDGGKDGYYFTDGKEFVKYATGKKIIGYNVKSDLNWIRGLGLLVGSRDIHSDPMIQAYVANSNRDNQGLKDVAKEVLGWKWPSYTEMVHPHSPKKKVTLDKQDIEKVAEYCLMDAMAAWQIDAHFVKTFTPAQKHLYDNIELPAYKLIWEMECLGVGLDVAGLQKLDVEMATELTILKDCLAVYDSTWNPNSPPQTVAVLNRLGIRVSGSAKEDLAPYVGKEPVVDLLKKYKKMKKLHSTYVVPFMNQPRVHTTFNQVALQTDGELHGIRTGRLSSSGPNLQNIPAKRKGEVYGERIRGVFIPTPGKVFIDADYSQIEYRLLAHFSQEVHLVRGFHAGLDVHEVTGKLLGCERSVGKTLNFASIYGAGSEKIAATAGCTLQEAEKFLQSYWQKLPGVAQWVGSTKLLARGRGGVTTMSGRIVPLPDIISKNKWKRMHAERAAVNYVIQGSAADIIKVAMLRLYDAGFLPNLQVHDELLIEVDPKHLHRDMRKVKKIMEGVVKLTVPLVVDIHCGRNWNAAKGK